MFEQESQQAPSRSERIGSLRRQAFATPVVQRLRYRRQLRRSPQRQPARSSQVESSSQAESTYSKAAAQQNAHTTTNPIKEER